MKKRILSIIAIAVLVVILASLFVGCKKDEDADALAICLASEPASLDPALNSAVDGATMLIHLFAGLVKYDKDMKLVADAAESPPEAVENTDGTVTYTFTLREGMKWSNGDPVLASDFEWAWKRAASVAFGADYGYMFEVIKGYGEEYEKDSNGDPIYYELYTDDDEEADANHKSGTFKLDANGNKIVGNEDNGDLYYPVATATELAVVANDEARTLAVTLIVDVPYFYELCAFPAYFPVYNRDNHKIDADGTWATDPSTYICNGPYTIKAWSHNEYITLVKNENYYDAASITMPKIRFYLSDNESTMLTNYQTGDWLFIDDVPTNEIPSLKTNYPDEFQIGSQLGTYYISFNNNCDLLPASWSAGKTANERSIANAEVRKALGLLIDRDYICESIGQAGQVPASSFVALGLTDASSTDGKQFYQNAGHSDTYIGYYDATKAANASNKEAALTILKNYYDWDESKQEFTNFPGFKYIYNTNEGHKAIAEYIQAALDTYGIDMTLENSEWATFLDTRKAGNYGVSRNGWLGDYNDPISFLDMWTTSSGNNDAQLGKYKSTMTITNKYDASGATIYSMTLSDIDAKYAAYDKINATWAETYDVLIGLIKTETNTVLRYKLMHKAEDLLMSTGDICPLYYYTDIYMCSTKLTGFFASPLGYKYFMYTTLAA